MGVLLALMPHGIPIFMSIAIILLLITRNLTFSYGTAFVSLPFVAWLSYSSGILVIYSIVLPLIVGARHFPSVKEALATTSSKKDIIFDHRRRES